MIAILEILMESPISWAILALITICSLAYAIYCQHINKAKKEIEASVKTIGTVNQYPSLIEGLQILYNGKEVDKLCISRIAIWNSGNQTISASDVVYEKPITVFLGNNSQMLDARISQFSDETNKFAIKSRNSTGLSLEFEYVDPGEGVVLTLTHTGESKDVSLDCKIKGGSPIRIVGDNQTQIEKRDIAIFIYSAIGLSLFSIVTIIIFLALIGIIPSSPEKTAEDLLGGWMSFLTLAFCAAMGWYTSILRIRRKIPKSLRFYRRLVQQEHISE